MNEVTKQQLANEFGTNSRGIAVEILPSIKCREREPVVVFQKIDSSISFLDAFSCLTQGGDGSGHWIKGVADDGNYYIGKKACDLVLGGNKCQI